ncbi:MAG: FGGY-family carbohydrate kinase [Clostridia bacterium]|nr:FGGY-family carbohydrate kinase [Clostridia bacterium]
MRYVIGLDVGTTGTKAVVCDELGNIYGKGYKEYDLVFGDGGRVGQRAEDWYNAASYAVKKAVSDSGVDSSLIEAVALSTQGASMLAVDEKFNSLCDVITWMDKSTQKEVDELIAAFGEENLYRKAGWPLGCANDIPKILHIREHQTEIFEKAYSFVSTLEYMNFRMTGNNVSDPTNTAIRSLMDIQKGEYDADILDYLGIDKSKLPEIAPAGTLVGTLTKECADAFGLGIHVKVINGAHDQYCASIGSGAVSAGDMLVATGTTWVVLGIADKLIYTPSRVSPGIHPVEGLYGVMASLVSAGSALKWYKNIIGIDYSDIDKGAASHRDSAKELLFAPYLAGAGFPHTDRNMKAKIYGLEQSHDKYDIALALMEGVAFECKTVLEEYKKFGCEVSKLIMTGRTAHSDVWRGLVRDITNCEILITDEPDTCCVGAAVMAAVGAGIYPDYRTAANKMVKVTRRDIPVAENVEFYREKYQKYIKAFN